MLTRSLGLNRKLSKLNATLIIMIIAIIGTYLLVSGHASSPYVGIASDSGVLAKGATSQICSGASNGICVQFGTASSALPMDGNVALALTSSGTPFAATSFWNTPLPANTPVSPNNAAYLSTISEQLCHPQNTPLANPCDTDTASGTLNSTRWSDPFYVVPANQPLVAVKPYCNGSNISQGFITGVLDPGVPIPADAHAAAGTDEHISIYQPSTDKLWEFWRFQKDSSNNWEACWGGVMGNVSQSNGIFPYPYGGWTTGLPQLGAVIRIEELQAGQIDHVMGLGMYDLLNGSTPPANVAGAANGISWPANRSDGTSMDPLAIPEGQRFRLNPALDVNSLNLSPVAKVIAVAAQKYGFVVGWTAGTVGLSLGDPTPYTAAGLANPYTSGPGVGGQGDGGLYQGITQPSAIMKNFPWDQLEALPFNYGEPPGP